MTDTIDRRSFLGHAAAGGAATLSVGSAQAAVPDNLATLVGAARAEIRSAMAENAIGAVAVSLVQGRRTVWSEGFGLSASSQAVTPDTLFSIQSTSKNFTAVAILLAVQEGLLDLDIPVSRYWPEFRVLSRFESAPQDRMTLRHLLAHRAGFTHEAPVGNNYEPATPSFEAHVRSISRTWLRFPVGDRYRYSNLGYDLAAHLLERRTGQTFAAWLKRELFEPLGMNDTTLDPAIYGRVKDRAAGTHRGYSEVPLVTPLIGSGGVWTTARDMASYLGFHCAKGRWQGRQILAGALWDEMHGFGLGGDYDLGVMRSERRYGSTPVRVLHHRGGGFGFGCNFVYCPEADIGWVAMFNRPALAGYRFGMDLMDRLLVARFGPQTPRQPAANLIPIRPLPSQIHGLTGNYVGRNVRADIDGANGAMRITFAPEEGPQPLIVTSLDDIFAIAPGGETRFYRRYPATASLPTHLESFEGEESLDFNAGPYDPPGPDKADWHRHVGSYRIEQWGRPAMDVAVALHRGYLMINDIRLIVELEPGLFFTSDGEAVDFRTDPPTWRNLRLRRV